MPLMLLGPLGLPELIGIGILVILLFGANKLPQLGAGIGQGIRNFKDTISGKDEALEEPKEESNKNPA